MPEDRDLLPIAIPHGRSGNTGYLSVYFAPRLHANGVLSDFSDWTDWPAVVRAMNFTIRVNSAIVAFTQTSADPSTPKWNAVLPDDLLVQAWFNVDRRVTRVATFDQSSLVSKVSDVYAQTLRDFPTTPPTAAELVAHPVAGPLLTGGAAASPLPDAREFLAPIPSVPGDPPEVPLEFHQVLSMLNAHPALLRQLGLVVDFEVTLPALDPFKVRVQTDWRSTPKGQDGTEVAIVMQTTPEFWPQSNPFNGYSEQAAGWVELGDGDWSVTELDDLTATRRLGSLADGLAGGAGGLPVQEDHGISLLRNQNAGVLQKEWERRQEIESAIETFRIKGTGSVNYYAEDATLGYRFDVRDQAVGEWRSLFQRQADRYKFLNNTSQNNVPAADEGWTTFVLSSEQREVYLSIPDQGIVPLAKQRIRDSRLNWQGWSVAVPRPAKVIDETGALVDPPVSHATAADIAFETHYGIVPLTLPKLRYSHTYDFRGRATYLGGISRPLTDVEFVGIVSPQIEYGRTTPVGPPAIVRRFDKPQPGSGEQVDTIVLLGNYNLSPAQVAKQERILLPPSAPQEQVELHDLPNGGIDPAAYKDLKKRDAASVATQCVVDPVSGELVANPSLGAPPAVKFLAEPPSNGAAFTTLPGRTTTMVIPWQGTWPSLRGIRLIVVSGTGAPALHATVNGAVLTVPVPKATDLTVALSSALDAAFLDHFAYWNALAGSDQTALTSDALDGRLWMLSPGRDLRLIHAVRQPMTPSTIESITGDRPAVGALVVQFDATIALDHASTDSVKLTATFTDPIDHPADSGPSTQGGSVVLGRFSVDPAGSGDVVIDDVEVSFHDQKRHDTVVEAEVFSRFAKYFTSQLGFAFSPDVRVLDPAGVVGDSVVVTDTAKGSAFAVDVDYTVDAAAGSITRVASGSIASGASVTALYIARPISRRSTEGGVDAVPFVVAASRAPDPLTVREVVPASAVTESAPALANYVERVRTGTILRVWSERGWYGSGGGELLGVVIDAAPGGVPSTTRFGRDPVTAGDASPQPALGQFARTTVTHGAVEPGLDVAGYAIGFDETRALWYSDIEITGLDYRPFVRLSLARYQPVAVAGVHLSPVIDVDPIRLGLTRTTRVTTNPNGSYTIRVTGIEHEGVPDESAGNVLLFNTVTVQFQEVDTSIADPDLRWTNIGPVYTLARTKLVGGLTQWQATRSAPAGSGTPKRVVVAESEPVMRRLGETGVQASKNEVSIETIELVHEG